MPRLRLIMLPAVLLIGGCVPVLVGGLIYKSSKTREQKQEFMAQFHRTNTERAAQGAAPLDWCEEAYRFDKGWAVDDAACRKRVEAYEGGKSERL